jgi:hypothetical protein
MLSYALKRVSRSFGLFAALLLGVILAPYSFKLNNPESMEDLDNSL